MHQLPAFNTVGGRVFQQNTCARARSAGHVATPDPPGGVLRPTRPGVRVVCAGPGPGWGGPGLLLPVLSASIRDTWRHRTRSQVRNGSAAVAPPEEFGHLCPAAQPFKCGLRSPSQVCFLHTGGWGTPVTGY